MSEHRYEIAISFAGEDRHLAEQLAHILKFEYNLEPFFDDYNEIDMIGKDLVKYFDQVFQHDSLFVVVIASGAYSKSAWATAELNFALGNTVFYKEDYIIPVVVEDCEIPGLNLKTKHSLKLSKYSLDEIAYRLVQKVVSELDVTADKTDKIPLEKSSEITLTPEFPNDSEKLINIWRDRGVDSHDEMKIVNESECAWVLPWKGEGLHIKDIIVNYNYNSIHNYNANMLPLVKSVISSFKQLKPKTYGRLAAEPLGNQVRLDGVYFNHKHSIFEINLSPCTFLYYISVHARLWASEFSELRNECFENSLELLENGRENPLFLPSNFALHMGVVSKDNYLLIRKRTSYTELFPSAWEAGIGEFMHGPTGTIGYPHFTKDGQPDLFLFFKNAVKEELNVNANDPDDFSMFGFAVEYRTLAPKLLVVYRSKHSIDKIIDSATTARDKAPRLEKAHLSCSSISTLLTDPEYKIWGPTSKLVMMLALTQFDKATENNITFKRLSDLMLFKKFRRPN